MNPELEALACGALHGELDDDARRRLAEALGKDPQALAEFADQLEIHHRLQVALRGSDPLTAAVLREIGYQGDADFSRRVVEQVRRFPPRRSWLLWAAVASFLLVVGAVLFVPATPTVAAGPRVLFVVGAIPPGPGDAAVRDRLRTLGFEVSLRGAWEASPSDAAGMALVAVSSTAFAEDVAPAAGTAFRDLPVPILCWEPRLYHDLGMIPGSLHKTDWAASKGLTALSVAPHELSGGLSGTLPVAGAPEQFSWGRVRADALRVASIDESRAAVFAYDRGAAMPGLAAPARRVGFFLFDDTAVRLTPEGWTLFDAAVRWCVR